MNLIVPATHHIDFNAKLIVTTWEGNATDIELIDAITQYQQDLQVNPEYIEFNEVADFSRVDSIKLTPEGILQVGKIAIQTDRYKAGSKLAIVVTSTLAFNLARLYTSYRKLDNNSNKEVRIFSNVTEAFDWAQPNCPQEGAAPQVTGLAE